MLLGHIDLSHGVYSQERFCISILLVVVSGLVVKWFIIFFNWHYLRRPLTISIKSLSRSESMDSFMQQSISLEVGSIFVSSRLERFIWWFSNRHSLLSIRHAILIQSPIPFIQASHVRSLTHRFLTTFVMFVSAA